MKTNQITLITITGLLLIVLTQLFLNSRQSSDINVCCNSEIDDIENCSNPMQPPRGIEELNKLVRFNINLNNQCDFQPIHVEIARDTIFGVIGRFETQKMNNSRKRKITSIELHSYNLIKDQDRVYRVVSVGEAQSDPNNPYTKIIEIDLSTTKPKPGESNMLKTAFEVSKETVLDFKIAVDGVLTTNAEDIKWIKGRICKSNVVF